MYELPDENLEKIIIDENSVMSNSEPIKLLKTSKNKSASSN
jgi:ATP-dependent Clp protease ATP-binding subunit ClpX